MKAQEDVDPTYVCPIYDGIIKEKEPEMIYKKREKDPVYEALKPQMQKWVMQKIGPVIYHMFQEEIVAAIEDSTCPEDLASLVEEKMTLSKADKAVGGKKGVVYIADAVYEAVDSNL